MKADELMIGDWVIRRGVPEEPMRLYDMNVSVGIAYLDQDGRDVLEKFENIKPILLTQEILEKNLGVLDEIDGSYRLPYLGFWVGGRCAPFAVMISNVYVELNYVHELQHALRLCGIKNEIEL